MNRDEWTFPYPADELLGAATTKATHHRDRISFWEGKKSETMEKVRAEGIEVDESLADFASNSYSRNPTVSIRDDLLRDLSECQSKIREHRGKAEDYEAWTQVLGSQGKAGFLLHHDDWMFFFGK